MYWFGLPKDKLKDDKDIVDVVEGVLVREFNALNPGDDAERDDEEDRENDEGDQLRELENILFEYWMLTVSLMLPL